MEFGIFNSLYMPHHLSDLDPEHAEANRLRDEVAWTVAADRAGFKYTWATEHHFLTQYSHLSANESFLAYVAALTDNIHLGSGIFNVTPPVNHPARVAERVAILDILSEGRFEFGMGRGSSTTEQRGFGIHDPQLTTLMFDEVVPQFRHMWKETEYAFEGQFFSMPPRNVLPKPATKPHPPMWVAAGNPGTFEKAARMGLGVLCFTTGSPASLAPMIETYKRTIDHAEPVGDYVNNNVMVTSQMLCLEDGHAGASNRLQHDVRLPEQPRVPLSRHLPEAAGDPGVARAHSRADPSWSASTRSSRASWSSGRPRSARKAVQAYVDAGADQLTFGMLSTTMPVEVAIEAVETFGAAGAAAVRQGPDPQHDPPARSTSGCRSRPGSRRGRARAAPVADLTRKFGDGVVPRTEGRSRPQHDPTLAISIHPASSTDRRNRAPADRHGERPGTAYAELHLLDGSTLLDNRRASPTNPPEPGRRLRRVPRAALRCPPGRPGSRYRPLGYDSWSTSTAMPT